MIARRGVESLGAAPRASATVVSGAAVSTGFAMMSATVVAEAFRAFERVAGMAYPLIFPIGVSETTGCERPARSSTSTTAPRSL